VSNKLTRLVKEPLIQFLIIGACIYGAYAMFGAPQDSDLDKTIVVDAARVQSFASQWSQRWNRLPTEQELDGVINAYVRDEILYRQALAMGLGEDDPVTRRRLAQKLEFLTSDVALLKEPATGELEQYFQDHEERHRDPDLVTFSHVFFDPDLRDETTLDDAEEVLAQLQAAGVPDPATLDAGDRFMLQNYYAAVSELEIRRQLGSGFTESVMQLEPRQWHGPVLSGYGVHLVYIYDFQQAAPPAFEAVQKSVLQDWQTEQQAAFNAEFFESLRKRYEVVIADVPAELTLDTGTENGVETGSDESTRAEADPAS
jgi:peptidyl-prolyl cis-trans isomerase C